MPAPVVPKVRPILKVIIRSSDKWLDKIRQDRLAFAQSDEANLLGFSNCHREVVSGNLALRQRLQECEGALVQSQADSIKIRESLQDKVDFLAGEAQSLQISLRDTKEAYLLIEQGDVKTQNK